MRKKIFSLFLAAVMVLSMMVVVPISVSAEGNTFDATNYDTTETFTISTADDMMNFAAAVDGGKNFAGKEVVLAGNIDLSGKTWKGIGYNNGTWMHFCGTFDGKGYTISNLTASTGNSDRVGALFNSLAGAAVVKNFTLNGTITLKRTGAGNNNFYGSIAARVGGSDVYDDKGVTIQNVHSSVIFDGSHFEDVSLTNCGLFYVGGLVGYLNSGDMAKLTIDSCVYDGSIICNATAGGGSRPYYFGGLVAFTGHRNASVDRSIYIKNSVYAGEISLVSGNHVGALVGGISDYCSSSNATTRNIVEITDTIAIGTVSCSGSNASYNGELVGAFSKRYTGRNQEDGTPTGYATLKMTNVYYVDVQVSDDMLGTTNDAAVLEVTNVVKTTHAGVAALSADDFSDATALSFKASTYWDTYYPCPTSMLVDNAEAGTVKLVAEGEWVASLKVSVDAKVLGASIRYNNDATLYSGIRFVAEFRETLAKNIGNADANFGLILISKAAYDGLTDKTSFEELKTAGVQVPAIMAETKDGIVTVKAVVYNIDKEDYDKEIVAIPYIDGAVAGDALPRSIYYVANECVNDENVAVDAPAKVYSQGIVEYVTANTPEN